MVNPDKRVNGLQNRAYTAVDVRQIRYRYFTVDAL